MLFLRFYFSFGSKSNRLILMHTQTTRLPTIQLKDSHPGVIYITLFLSLRPLTIDSQIQINNNTHTHTDTHNPIRIVHNAKPLLFFFFIIHSHRLFNCLTEACRERRRICFRFRHVVLLIYLIIRGGRTTSSNKLI